MNIKWHSHSRSSRWSYRRGYRLSGWCMLGSRLECIVGIGRLWDLGSSWRYCCRSGRIIGMSRLCSLQVYKAHIPNSPHYNYQPHYNCSQYNSNIQQPENSSPSNCNYNIPTHPYYSYSTQYKQPNIVRMLLLGWSTLTRRSGMWRVEGKLMGWTS